MITLLNRLDDSDNNRITNRNVNEIGKYFLDKKGVTPQEILFTKDDSHLGFFDYNKGEVIFSSKKTDELAEKYTEELVLKYSIIKKYSSYIYNYHRFLQIYFALMHAVRKHEFENGQLDLLHQDLYGLNLKYSDNGIIYFDGKHNRLPLEIESSVIAHNEAYSMIRSTKLPKSRLRVFGYEQLAKLLSYYELEKSPIESLGEDITIISQEVPNLSKREKLNIGFPLDYKEKMQLEDERDRILKKIL